MAAIITTSLFVAIFALFYGHYHFYHSVEKDKDQLFNKNGNTERPVVQQDLRDLPQLLVDYLKKVGVEGICSDCHLTFKQRGRIRKNASSKWMDFSAKQLMSAVPIGFIWAAKSFPLFVKDRSIMGIGETNVSLFGLLSIGKKQSHKIHESALNRCLAELPLYPIAFLNKAITWKVLNENSLKANLIVDNTKAKGVFYFNENGLIERFESERYRGEVLDEFVGKFGDYEVLSDLYVPTKMKALWKLKEGDFEYFNCEIMDYRID